MNTFNVLFVVIYCLLVILAYCLSYGQAALTPLVDLADFECVMWEKQGIATDAMRHNSFFWKYCKSIDVHVIVNKIDKSIFYALAIIIVMTVGVGCFYCKKYNPYMHRMAALCSVGLSSLPILISMAGFYLGNKYPQYILSLLTAMTR